MAIYGYKARQTIYKSSTPPKVRELTEFPMHELFAEFEHNRKIAAEFSGDNMLTLQTDVWDARRYSSHDLPANLLGEMQQVYADIELLNRLVWLATELGCQSSSLDDYKNLLVRIVEKINKIEEVVSSSGIVE